MDAFREGLRRTEEATRRPVSDVIATDEAAPMSDADFDDALWLALLGRISTAEDLRGFSPGVRMYFATRMVEWEIGNGGFGQVFENGIDDYFEEAMAGYRMLDDEASVGLILRAQGPQDDEPALDALDQELDGSPWNGVPWSDELRVQYARSHRDEFRL